MRKLSPYHFISILFALNAQADFQSPFIYGTNAPLCLIPQADGVVKSVSNQFVTGATTTDLPEGTNLYYTQARFDIAFAGKTTTNLAEGTNLYYTDARARAAVSATSPITYSSSTGVFAIPAGSSSVNGYISSTDWNTFNNKVSTTRQINTTSPLTGGGDLSADRTIVIPAGNSTTNGYIASGDWTLFNVVNYPVTKTLYVDNARTDTYTATGTLLFPFKTIGAAITQVITNADNATKAYNIIVAPGNYNETLTFNSALLYNLNFQAGGGSSGGGGGVSVGSGTAITSTSNNTQLATLLFSGFIFNGAINFTGDINNTNFCSSQCVFTNCSFNNSGSTITLNNVNNVSWYGGQVQGGSSVQTFTNVAFAYIQGVEGFKSGTTLHLVQNNATNQPSQTLGNYLLISETKIGSTVTIDAGSELDAIQSYFSSASNITNNGIIHSFQSTWSGAETFNSGSSTRLRGDTINSNPTLSGGATTTNQSTIYLGAALIGSTAAPATNALVNVKDGHYKSTQTTVPTATVNANAGTGATCTVANTTDVAGKITLVSGSLATPAAGTQCTVNFNKTWAVAPICVISPANTNAGTNLVQVYVNTATTSALPIAFNVAAAATTTYIYTFHCLETQ